MKLSKNFDDSEFFCPCCGRVIISPSLILKLQVLRDTINKPVHITSGYRCTTYNNKIGGAANSPHLTGMAADIRVEGISILELAEICVEIGFKRVGIYPNHVHVDMIDPHPSLFWYVRKYGVAPIYSGATKTIGEFLKKVIK